MNTTFLIDGGAGRVINSIPALEKYEKLNPNDDFKVIVHGWESVFWSHPTLQKRVFGAHQKGNFEHIIKDNRIVSPEPYRNHNFFNLRINLVEAFDEEINNTEDHSDLNYTCLYLAASEKARSKEHVDNLKNQHKKTKMIVFQPFGSSAELLGKNVHDKSNRSMESDDYFKLVQSLSTDAVIFYASQPQLRHKNDNISISFDEIPGYHRTLMCLISNCDYYVGCCSVGQHVARAFNKPGLILMGGTNELNFSYSNHFKIYRKKNRTPKYIPWRLSDVDCEFADRENEGLMKFTTDELNEIISIIKTDLKVTKSTLSDFSNSISYD